MRGSHLSDNEGAYTFRHDAVYIGRELLTFRKDLLSLSSVYKSVS
jgi:hypothetical protein